MKPLLATLAVVILATDVAGIYAGTPGMARGLFLVWLLWWAYVLFVHRLLVMKARSHGAQFERPVVESRLGRGVLVGLLIELLVALLVIVLVVK